MFVCRTCNKLGASKILYAGLPGKHCEFCGDIWGLAKIPILIYFNGILFQYNGISYWKALYYWLQGPTDDE